MSATISLDDIYFAVMLIAVFLVVLSLPTVELTVRNSSRLMKRYRYLRSIERIDSEGEVPRAMLDEWKAVRNSVGYAAMISDEIGRLNGLRPTMLQAEIAIVLIVLLMLLGTFTPEVMWLMSVVIVLTLTSVVYGALNSKTYIDEYITLLMSVEEKDEEAIDAIYG